MERLEEAELMNLAVNAPERLKDERAAIVAMAGGGAAAGDATMLITRAERIARFIRKGRVLEDEVLVS